MNEDDIRKREARDKLILANMGLVRWIVSRFVGRGVDRDDLIQEGMRGLIRACDDYDESRGKFSNYACHWIANAMRIAVVNQACNVRASANAFKLLGRYNRVRDKMDATTGRSTGPDEVMDEMKLKPVQRECLMKALMTRLDPLRMESQPRFVREDIEIASGRFVDPPDEIMSDREQEEIRRREVSAMLADLDGLDGRTRDVIRMRFGIGRDRSVSRRDVAEHFGLTETWFRQIQIRAIKKLGESRRPEGAR